MSQAPAVEILLVDDNSADVRLTHEALKESKVQSRLSVVCDGVEAMAFLRHEEPYQDAPRPDLILLDLNMPRKDGREVLVEVKTDPDLRGIPIVVLTTSSAEDDVSLAYCHLANSFVTKPVDFEKCAATLNDIVRFWTTVVRLPRQRP